MTETKLIYQEKDSKQPLEMPVLDFEHVFDTSQRQAIGQNSQIPDPGMEGTLKRIIAHLKDEKKGPG